MNQYWTAEDFRRTAKNYAKGKGKLVRWVVKIGDHVSLLIDIRTRDGFVKQESIVL